MTNKTHQVSEMIPIEGDFLMEGQFSLHCMKTATIGDLFYTGIELESDFGQADCTVLGKQHYFAMWENYHYQQGLICSAQSDQPIFSLHFQLRGSTQSVLSSMDANMDFQPGEANLMVLPPMNDTFELREEIDGNTFGILLSKDYLSDLAKRYPVLLEPVLVKMKQKDFSLLREQNLRVTPRMRGIIHRIQNHDSGHMAGSLFLEAQILDLLSQMFAQHEHPASSNGDTVSRSDLERIHLAREILLERLDDPPTLSELTKLVGTNEFKLKRDFKEIFGISPYAYHLQHKLELARTYILDTDLTISEISYRVGYSDPAHLTKAFRKQYGIRPSDLR